MSNPYSKILRLTPFLSITGTGLRLNEKLFVGWFGPRGLASIVFAVIVLNQNLPHGHTISMTVVCTILLSIVLHGLSANRFARAIARNEPAITHSEDLQ